MPKVTRIDDDDPDDLETVDALMDSEAVSLEQLSQTYAKLMVPTEMDSPVANPTDSAFDRAHEAAELSETQDGNDEDRVESLQPSADGSDLVTPVAILEAMLFVGNPDNKSLSASQLAGLMRGVQSDEIAGFVNELNASYKENSQALFIADVEGGFRMQLAPHMHEVRARMHGKIKEARLNQDAIDCLALVAYQPGIERRHLEQQVSRKMDGVINMLVRRDMIRLERKPVKGQPAERRYFPTDRMLNLFGLESLDELPHVGDLD